MKTQKYKFELDIGGLILFLIIMLPNLISFSVPAPNNILGKESATPALAVLDAAASFFRVITVAALCGIKNAACPRPMKKGFTVATAAAAALYFIGWLLYYAGFTNPCVILNLCVAPCAAFMLFSLGRKNIFSFAASIIFMLCHVIYSVGNFIIL